MTLTQVSPDSGAIARKRAFLRELFLTATAVAHPRFCLAPHLPPPPKSGRIIVLAAGKAAGAMAETTERHYLDVLKFPPERIGGLAVARYGYGRPTRRIAMMEAGHPIPDDVGLAAANRALGI